MPLGDLDPDPRGAAAGEAVRRPSGSHPPIQSKTFMRPVRPGRHYRINSPPDSPIGLAALKSTASMSTRVCLFLLPPVLPFLPYGHSEDRSRKFARSGKKDGVVRGVGQHRDHRLSQSKNAGRICETAGSTSDLKSHNTVALLGREIYAIGSLRQMDLQ